ncbi:MAG: hypothetical protein JWQ40_2121 [Segetibacter sp.]|nr:hypothetical protein [Segetibacter sp.]
MKIFFDTNILVKLLENSVELPKQHHYLTFEKCLYEVKNGFKLKLYDSAFLNSLLQNTSTDGEMKDQDSYLKEKFLAFIEETNYSRNEIIQLKKAFNKYFLKFEYGIASEYEFMDLAKTDDIGLIKNLFKNLKILLRTVLSGVEERVCSYNIEQLLYEQIFDSDLSSTNFREILDDSLINTKDLEIVFAALKTNCKLFLSSDFPLIKETKTLGLNHTTEFVYINPDDNFEQRLGETINTAYNSSVYKIAAGR